MKPVGLIQAHFIPLLCFHREIELLLTAFPKKTLKVLWREGFIGMFYNVVIILVLWTLKLNSFFHDRISSHLEHKSLLQLCYFSSIGSRTTSLLLLQEAFIVLSREDLNTFWSWTRIILYLKICFFPEASSPIYHERVLI